MVVSDITEEQYQNIRAYVRDIADKLELRDWTTMVSREFDLPKDAAASMRVTYGRKFVTIWLGKHFFDNSPEYQRHTICHELIHVHFYGWRWAFNNLKFTVNRDVFTVVEHGICDIEELATDALADAIAKHMPLPTNPDKRRRKASLAKMDADNKALGKDSETGDRSCTVEDEESYA